MTIIKFRVLVSLKLKRGDRIREDPQRGLKGNENFLLLKLGGSYSDVP